MLIVIVFANRMREPTREREREREGTRDEKKERQTESAGKTTVSYVTRAF